MSYDIGVSFLWTARFDAVYSRCANLRNAALGGSATCDALSDASPSHL
jgi:hypothetical protein